MYDMSRLLTDALSLLNVIFYILPDENSANLR